ncbi:MAG TPA: hypothetical protein PKC79_08945 [Solidesulfovibrio magneticus]|nr:hypothetical protein [Solidesulfovibrio magneticus]
MKNGAPHVKRCFFGCNSAEGFRTFFDFLPRLDNARIIIVKGGPGTGKSTFIGSVGKAFADQGYDLEYQHCSLDPQSYDAVVIPDIRAVVVAATGHHVFDPRNPGAVDEILNLGEYWDLDAIRPHRREIIAINEASEQKFHKVYRLLKAARLLLGNVEAVYAQRRDPKEIDKIAQEIVAFFPDMGITEGYGAARHAFISSITPAGEIHNVATVLRPDTQVLALRGESGSGRSPILEKVGEEARLRGFDVEFFHRPLDPNLLDHLYLPLADLVVTTQPEALSEVQPLATFDLGDRAAGTLGGHNAELVEDMVRYETMLQEAVTVLAQAKSTHEQLEQYYIPNMDFNKVDKRLRHTVEELLRHAAAA